MDNAELAASGSPTPEPPDRSAGTVPDAAVGSVEVGPAVVAESDIQPSRKKRSRKKAGSPSGKRDGLGFTPADWGIVAPTPSVASDFSGLTSDEVAKQLGISQARASQQQIIAMGKIRRAMLRTKFGFSRDDLFAGKGPRRFFVALTHALAERAFADRWGLSLADAQWVISELGIDPTKPETWLTKSTT